MDCPQERRYLFLQLHDAVKQCFGSWRAPRDVDVHRNNAVTAADDGVRVVVVPTAVCTTAHGDDPSRLWHLIVHLSQRWCHFIGQSSSNDHDVRLPRTGTEHDAEAVHIVPVQPDQWQEVIVNCQATGAGMPRVSQSSKRQGRLSTRDTKYGTCSKRNATQRRGGQAAGRRALPRSCNVHHFHGAAC